MKMCIYGLSWKIMAVWAFLDIPTLNNFLQIGNSFPLLHLIWSPWEGYKGLQQDRGINKPWHRRVSVNVCKMEPGLSAYEAGLVW